MQKSPDLKKKKKLGMSVVEVVVAMAILMVSMMSLAFVYPKGRTLTDSSKISMQATEIARSIVEEIKIRPLLTRLTARPTGVEELPRLGIMADPGSPVPGYSLINLTRADMNTLRWPFHHFATSEQDWHQRTPVLCWEEIPNHPTALRALLDQEGKTFFLPSSRMSVSNDRIMLRGIEVYSAPLATTIPQVLSVAVTVGWLERIKESTDINFITLNTVITENKYQ